MGNALIAILFFGLLLMVGLWILSKLPGDGDIKAILHVVFVGVYAFRVNLTLFAVALGKASMLYLPHWTSRHICYTNAQAGRGHYHPWQRHATSEHKSNGSHL